MALLAGVMLVSSACRNDMHSQPRYKVYAETDFFSDGRSERPAIEDTVARGQLHLDDARYTGKINGKDVEAIPIQITKDDLLRGQERMIVARGLRQPPSYHDERLLNAPIGHFFDVITNGYGAMYSYASRVSTDDRWRIAAYIRALQLSQNAPADVAMRYEVKTGGAPAGGSK
jgi:hypothetical protein